MEYKKEAMLTVGEGKLAAFFHVQGGAGDRHKSCHNTVMFVALSGNSESILKAP